MLLKNMKLAFHFDFSAEDQTGKHSFEIFAKTFFK